MTPNSLPPAFVMPVNTGCARLFEQTMTKSRDKESSFKFLIIVKHCGKNYLITCFAICRAKIANKNKLGSHSPLNFKGSKFI